jgi:transposase
VFEGSCTRLIFETYLKRVLIPELQPGQTVIMDNASFHKGGRIIELIEQAHCEVMYLPAYSPDLNPIEHQWTAIKNTMRTHLPHCNRDLYEAANHAFKNNKP